MRIAHILTRRLLPALAGLFAFAAIQAATATPAAADFRLCNNTRSKIGIALGYKEADGWVTEGWWNLAARSCETLLKGTLVARFYYVYAIDYDRGGEWSGKAFLCTRDREFMIKGTQDCLARGYERTGFFEVDTAEQRAWTVQLTETADQAAPSMTSSSGPALTPLPQGVPGAPRR